MQIEKKKLVELVPLRKWIDARMPHVNRRLAVVHTRYCDPLTARDLCPQVCEKCKTRLLDAVERSGNAGNPYGLLTNELKRAVAIMVEQAHQHEFKPVKNLLGEGVEQDAFSELEKLYG
jgi:hypothetical protein